MEVSPGRGDVPLPDARLAIDQGHVPFGKERLQQIVVLHGFREVEGNRAAIRANFALAVQVWCDASGWDASNVPLPLARAWALF